MEHLICLVTTLFFAVLAVIVALSLILAALGKSLGIRKAYIKLLLRIFEYGRKRIDSYRQSQDGRGDESEGLPDETAITDSSECETDEETDQVITRDISISATQGIKIPSRRPDYDLKWRRRFHISDVMYFAKCGVEAVIQDDVTQRFTAEELKNWNFLTRTDKGYQFISVRLTILWSIGCFVRYGLLLPFRMCLCIIGISWLITSTFFIGYIPDGRFKRALNKYSSLTAHRILCRAMSSVVTFHGREKRPLSGICVANHTSPIDVIILSSDNCYAMVGQCHTGFLGLMQRALSRATAHIWFERSEVKDRLIVSQRMKDHVDDSNKLPILIFPEGTCVNNTSVMMFKKGGFEVTPIVYPVAIKYDSRFGDVFWNSSKESMVRHIFNIMTSWALVVDIWYLPPIKRGDGEDSVRFANRVKSAIARQGGLVDLEWDGQLKRMKVKDTWKNQSQRDYFNLLKLE